MREPRILLIRTGGLGDSLLLWPGVAAVRRRFARARIDLMGQSSRLQLLVVPKGADRALDVEGSGLHRLFEISAEPPDEVRRRFAAYHIVVAFAATTDCALAENLSACGAGEVHAFLPFPPQGACLHVADYVRQSLLQLDLAAVGDDPLLEVTQRERSLGSQRLRDAALVGRRLALLAPGSGSVRKNWPPRRFAALAEALREARFEPVLLRGPADAEAVEAVLTHSRRQPVALADAGPTELKGLLAHASLYVGNDAGPTHLAALIGIPTVAIFGPSDPVRWHPRGPRVALVRSDPPELASVPVSQVLAACVRLAS